jgi:predicted ester cyclase
MQFTTEQNKKAVIRFNKEFIEQGRIETFNELVAENVCNHSAPAGSSAGPDGMFHFLNHVLRAGFPDIRVDILEQVAEGNLVTTRKVFHATHTGNMMGIQPSGKKVVINVIDIIRLKNGQYTEHWGMSNLPEVIAEISRKD